MVGDKTTHFGFSNVASQEKQSLVNAVFDGVASKYDLMNDVMSGGLHRLWKNAMVNWLNPPKDSTDFTVLDVAGGTGDIAFRILDNGGENTHVTICDINNNMLKEGEEKANKYSRYFGRLGFVTANAENLSFSDSRFDAYTIAFGIRNVTNINKALEEAYRVLKTGGQFLCLEFSQVDMPVLAELYDAYSFTAIPALGKVITGDGAPYRYLVESIRKFPGQIDFDNMLRAAGFSNVSYRNMSGGIVAIHSGFKV